MIVDFLTAHDRWPWSRQIGADTAPGLTYRFTAGTDAGWLVVYDDIGKPVSTLVPRARRMLFVTEPPGIKTYPRRFLEQFGTIVSPMPLEAPGSVVVRHHPALPWFFGVRFGADGSRAAALDLEGLRALGANAIRQPGISAVISQKSKLPRHRERLAFVEALQGRLGPRLRIFGRGFEEIADKAEAILPYRYHLVLENNDIPNFWTEKLADAYLGWALPVYSGCATIGEDFPAGSFLAIDIARPAAAIDRIEGILAEDPAALRLDLIAAARRRLLDEHNLFALISRLIAQVPASGPTLATAQIIRPGKGSTTLGRLKAAAKRMRDA